MGRKFISIGVCVPTPPFSQAGDGLPALTWRVGSDSLNSAKARAVAGQEAVMV
jgi:hypothetical protein